MSEWEKTVVFGGKKGDNEIRILTNLEICYNLTSELKTLREFGQNSEVTPSAQLLKRWKDLRELCAFFIGGLHDGDFYIFGE
jgi:hypothetical protein